MLCKACQFVLQNTSACTGQQTTFQASLWRIRGNSTFGNCFLCTAVDKAVHGSRPFQRRLAGCPEDSDDLSRTEALVLGFACRIASRPRFAQHVREKDVNFVIDWEYTWPPSGEGEGEGTSTGDSAAGSLEFYFSPIHKDQESDESVGVEMRLLNRGAPSRVSVQYKRKQYSEHCPECRALDLPKDAFHTFLDPEQSQAMFGDTGRYVEDDDGNAILRDGFRLDPNVDGDVASGNTGSDQTWNQIRRWMDMCHATHDKCLKPTNSDGNVDGAVTAYNPTRLLDMQSPLDGDLHGPIRLITCRDEKPTGRYMTLFSHPHWSGS